MGKANVAPKKRRGKIVLITALILCVCLLAGLFVYFRFFSRPRATGPSFIMSPVAGLGLAPQQPVTLLAETVNCTKQSDGYVEYYAVEAEYKVQIDQGTTFLLPYPDIFRLTEENKVREDVLKRNLHRFHFSINGAARQMAFEYLPFAWYDYHSMREPEERNQSIYIFPNMGSEQNQPWNTYTQLINGYKERKTPFNIAADMPVRVYDVTQSPVYGAEEPNVEKKPASLEITGRRNQLRLFFGQSERSYVSGGYGKTINKPENITRDPYFWKADSLTASRYFVTTADTTPLQVCIGEEEIPYTETTFKDFLQTNLAIGEEELDEYIQTFCCYMAKKWAGDVNNYIDFASPDSFMRWKENYVYDKVKMGSYTIAEPGEYTIKLEFNIQGEINNEDYYMLQWIDSPSSMWKSVGERKLTVHMPEKSETVSIPEYVLNFSSVKEKSVSSPSQ